MVSDPEITCIFGARGYGKTYRARSLIKSRPRVVVFDCGGTWERDGLRTVTYTKYLAAAMHGNNYKIGYRPPDGRELEALEEIARFLMHVQRPYFDRQTDRTLTLVIEEADTCLPTSMPRYLTNLRGLILRGRHYGIEILIISQRPKLVWPTARGNAANWHVFGLNYEEDRREVCNMIGRQYADRLAGLPKRQAIRYESGRVILS